MGVAKKKTVGLKKSWSVRGYWPGLAVGRSLIEADNQYRSALTTYLLSKASSWLYMLHIASLCCGGSYTPFSFNLQVCEEEAAGYETDPVHLKVWPTPSWSCCSLGGGDSGGILWPTHTFTSTMLVKGLSYYPSQYTSQEGRISLL